MPGRKNCVVAYANVRGLHDNLVDLGALMAARRCDVMVCAETLVSTRRHVRHPAELRVTGYSYYGVTSVDSRPTARGMSVYVRQWYPCVRKSWYSCHEVVCLRIRAKHMDFYVFAVYRNPGADDSLLDCLLTAMSEVQQTHCKSSFVLGGEFNVSLLLCWVANLTHITESGLAQSLRLLPLSCSAGLCYQ